MSLTERLPPGVAVLERGWLSANNVLLMDDDSTTIVDTGYCTHAEQTLALVRQALAGRTLDRIINTHLHSDHCGGNAVLQEAYPGVRTQIPPGQARHVRQWDPVALTYIPTGQLCPRFSADEVIAPGSSIFAAGLEWQVHGAPGHDPHSIILFEPSSRTLVSADALWQNGFGVIFPELEGVAAYEEVGATLDLIETFDAAVVLPGHGPIFTDIRSALRNARARLQAFISQPRKHASHAAKVLLKFKLLELQQVEISEFMRWARGTSYFGMVHERWFGQLTFDAWIEWLAEELVRSGAASRSGGLLVNA